MRYKDSRLATLLGIVGNIFLFIIKVTVGLISNSYSMLADSFNSGSDIFNSLMTFIGNKIASKKADQDHNLGHGKAEYIFSLLISVTMIFAGLEMLSSSFISLFNPSDFKFSIWLIVVCIITIIVKFFLFLFTNTIARKHNNLLIYASSKDHRNDCIVTLTNLISIILTSLNIKYIDGIVGMLISLYIIFSAFEIFKSSYDILMDKSISNETKQKVLDIIKSYDSIKGIRHFNSTPVGYQYQVSFTIFVDGNLSTFESHSIADKLEKEIVNKVDEIYLVIIHVNPYE